MSDLFRYLQTALTDRYQLERELGRGGMATVFLARELKHPRRVAIKVLRPELVGVMARERFLREIRISSEFTHPHILPLLDSGTVQASAAYPALPFYTMPYVEGESLRDRLAREKQLPVEDALGIARDVAAALGYAHARGVIHRDIKPENILLTGGQAVVADFGIARAIQEAVDPDALTSAGLVIGTPAYMSPEQAGGETTLDGRSDLYSLGCVLYEMLGGEPPFTGSSVQAVLARHRMDRAPSLRTIRSTVPEAIEQVVMRTLQKTPADRYPSAERFVAALTTGASGETVRLPARPRWLHRRSVMIGLVLAVGAGATWYVARGSAPNARADLGSGSVDTTRYAILSFGLDSGVPRSLRPALLLQDALARWSGIQVVDPFQVQDAVARRDTAGFGTEDWRRLAIDLGAGRFIRAEASRVGDSIRLHAVLYDVAAGRNDLALRERTVRLPVDLSGRDSAFADLGAGLLLHSSGAAPFQPAGRTSSLPARQAFEAGSSAINDWNLEVADSNFAEAARFDPTYAQAHLWLALVRAWADPGAPSTWRSPADRAAAGQAELSTRDRQIADALLEQARGDQLAACQRWDRLTRENPHDFVVWYGLAVCLSEDRIVVRDARSPTHWRFRSSYHAALNAYQQAYTLLPSILKGLRTDAYSRMVRLLLAGGNNFRVGHGLRPDPEDFMAVPSWAGDTLVLYPFPRGAELTGAGSGAVSTTEAIRRQRQRLYEIARVWVAEFPASADALQALAVSLQLLGDRSALDTLAHARGMAAGPAETVRVATSEIWMRVIFSAPAGIQDLRAARRLADSLLSNAAVESPPEPALLASLAALTGRAHLAARLGRRIPARDQLDSPPPLVGLGITFLTYASMGGPVDSLRAMAVQVSDALSSAVGGEDRDQAVQMWMHLPILVGFPAFHFPEVARFAGAGTGLLGADAAFLRGDTAAALRALQPDPAARASGLPFERTIDLGYGTAWLMAALGLPDSAVASLDLILTELPRTPAQRFLEVYQAGTLVRAMALRAELAEQLGDHKGAREWALAVVTLWGGADDFLQPLVNRMKALAK
jgi:serine/threonine protein kinase/tetratricopeptide (TPR) repeat protein